MHVCVRVRIYEYAYVHVYMCMCMRTCMRMCMCRGSIIGFSETAMTTTFSAETVTENDLDANRK